jgi:cytochrome b561
MWIGLTLLFGPISVLLDVLPPLGELGRSLIGAVTFVGAVLLTLATILVSSIVHSPLAWTVLLVVAGAVAAVGVKHWLDRRPESGVGQHAAG